MKIGGGSRTRTGDIRLAKPTLYQLSYAPGAAREAGSGSVSVYAGGFRFFVLGGVASKLAAPCVAGSALSGEDGASPSGLIDELTIGTPDRSGSVSLERR